MVDGASLPLGVTTWSLLDTYLLKTQLIRELDVDVCVLRSQAECASGEELPHLCTSRVQEPRLRAVREWRKDRYTYRKAGRGLPVLALTEHPGGAGCLLYPVAQGGGMVAFS